MRECYNNGDGITLARNECDGCSPIYINGIFVHEKGCPDTWRDKKKADIKAIAHLDVHISQRIRSC